MTPKLTATQENEGAETVSQLKIRQKNRTRKALNIAVWACLMAIDIATNQKVGGSNPFRRTKNTEVTFVTSVFLFIGL